MTEYALKEVCKWSVDMPDVGEHRYVDVKVTRPDGKFVVESLHLPSADAVDLVNRMGSNEHQMRALSTMYTEGFWQAQALPIIASLLSKSDSRVWNPIIFQQWSLELKIDLPSFSFTLTTAEGTEIDYALLKDLFEEGTKT